jgi:serine/threonine protein kinase
VAEGKKYQILKLVAKGGTAVLYKAIQTSLDRVVAVKKLHPHLTEDENFTRRFVLEAKAAASLDHTNIVKIIDFGTEDRLYYMVMDYIEGESLRELLDKWKQVPIDVALAIAHEVLAGLAHAHSKGIVHRDIKPGNIMIAEDGRPRITDFGLAKLLEGSTHQTAADTVLGTPLYMSPEQAFGESVDQRSDIFSLGTMLYEMITGVQPFADDNYMGVINNIAKKNAPHPSRLSVAVPQPVTAILSRAMNKNRDARFQTAGQFQKAIEKYLGHAKLNEARGAIRHLLTTEGATVQLPRTALAEERKSRLRRGFMAAIAVATLFGAAGVGYTLAPQGVQRQLQTTVRGWFNISTRCSPTARALRRRPIVSRRCRWVHA